MNGASSPEVRALVERSRGHSLSELASNLADLLVKRKSIVFGVTGPSSVGKTYFSNELSREVELRARTVATINSDSFLLAHLRGKGSFRANSMRPLGPEDFDVEFLGESLERLQQGKAVEYSTYIRGEGWHGSRTVQAADIVLVEGLFLDSVYFLRRIQLELILVLTANEQLIAHWRRERDEKIQQTMSRPFRNWVETEREIERTQQADEIYAREPSSARTVTIEVDAERKVSDFTE